MAYFLLLHEKDFLSSPDEAFYKSRYKNIKGFDSIKGFAVGDILSIILFSRNCPFSFEGMCFSIKKNSLLSPDVIFMIKNCLAGSSIYMAISYYYNRVYNMIFLNYKRNFKLVINKSKIYFLAKKLNNGFI